MSLPEPESPHFADSRSREAFREACLAEVPESYSPWLHLAGTVGVGAAAFAVALPRLATVRAVEWLTVPTVFALANLFEWHAHRNLLHRRRWPWHVLYDRHTPVHHRIYREGSMQIRELRELRFVLIPAAGVLGIVVLAAPAAAIAGTLFGPNVGWLFLAAEAAYVVGYELSHLAYHLPPEHPVQKVGLVRWLSRHHARHHDPRLMQRWNFNVTLPLGDLLFGTVWSEQAARRREARTAPRGAVPSGR